MLSPCLRTAAALILYFGRFVALPAAEPAPVPARPLAVEYTITDLGPRLHVAAINDRGDVIGTLHREERNSVAFLYSKGQLRELGTLGGPYSGAHDINDAGHIVGYARRHRRSRQSFAYDINYAGHIVGYASTPQPRYENVFERHGFLQADGVIRSLGTLDDIPDHPEFTEAPAINNPGVIVGQTQGMRA